MIKNGNYFIICFEEATYEWKDIYKWGNNKVMFPSEEELSRCEAFLYNASGTEKYNKMWKEIR